MKPHFVHVHTTIRVKVAVTAEEITDFLVDEADDPEFVNSCFYDAEYRPYGSDNGST